MFEACIADASNIPLTTFPNFRSPELQATQDTYTSLCEELECILIISDSEECNKNLSNVLKKVIDYTKEKTDTYQTCSVLALKLLNLNLFLKNYVLCLGKILSLVSVFSAPGHNEKEAGTLKQFLLVVLLLLLKLVGEADQSQPISFELEEAALCKSLSQLGFVRIMCDVVSDHIDTAGSSHTAYVLLKFNCDIIFQYLYRVVLLSDDEFESLTRSRLVSSLISDLLSNDNFNNYDLDGDDFNDESKLIAYEEFKLLLLINEQYMMKSMSCKLQNNRVFDGLLTKRKDSVFGICGFTNLLVYHLNREESHIIKILMLKFLYLIFTSSYSSKLPYLNDLKILVDIIIRELNDLDYSFGDGKLENSILALTYLKVLFPLLKFSQLSEITTSYKSADLVDMLRNVAVNCDGGSASDDQSLDGVLQSTSIVKMALKCLSIPCVRATKTPSNDSSRLMSNVNVSTDSLASASSLSSRVNTLKLESSEVNSSSESISITRVASVRTTTRNDFNRHTTSHNLESAETTENIFEANNSNVFRNPTSLNGPRHYDHAFKLLNIPKEYLNKELPPLPADISTLHVDDKSDSHSSLKAKAKIKKAPPPPPPPSRRRRQ